MCFHRSIWSLLVPLFSVLIFVPPTHAQRCVAQGDGVTWGACGGVETITIIIERPPQIMPQTQIVWVRPSAGASSQGEFSSITDPSIRMALKDLSVTGWQLFNKATKAQHAGNLQLAKDYCDAARSRKNSAEERREINIRCDLIGRALFDGRKETSATLEVDEIRRSADKKNRAALEIDFTDEEQKMKLEALFDPKRNDKQSEMYRQEILPLFIARAQAEAEAQQFRLMVDHPRKYPGNKTLTEKEKAAKTEALKAATDQADADVKKKLGEILPLIVTRK
jgi:hypothetical protein